MTDRRTERDYDETDDLLMNDDLEFVDGDTEEESEESVTQARNYNMDMRHRIEEKLEEKRLTRELNDYEFFDVDDDDDILH